MRLAPGAKHLLDGAWAVLAPVRHEFEVTVTGQGAKVESWQETLGMQVDPAKCDVDNKQRKAGPAQQVSSHKRHPSCFRPSFLDILDILDIL